MLSLRDITRDVQLPNGEDLHILRGTNLDVEAGEHISIVGHSGTGKSTLQYCWVARPANLWNLHVGWQGRAGT